VSNCKQLISVKRRTCHRSFLYKRLETCSRPGISIAGFGGRFELARLSLKNSATTNAGVSLGGLGCGLELAGLGLLDGSTADACIGGGRGGLALELSRLDGSVLLEVGHLGFGGLVSLVSLDEAAGYLRGGEGTLGQHRIGDLGVLLLRGAVGAPDLSRVFLEGLEVEHDGTTGALEAELVIGIVARNEGLKRICNLAAFRTILCCHDLGFCVCCLF